MSSGFVTETEIAEARRKRQEEWERVRQADQPLEAPEEVFDRRSLFERLQEQKQKKDLEYEEAHKLKNMIKGLDDDEIEFLDLVDRTKLAVERKKNLDEERELNDYRNRVATLQEKSLDQRLQAEISVGKQKAVPTQKHSQLKLLKGVVVKKTEPKKRKLSDSDENCDDKVKDDKVKDDKLKDKENSDVRKRKHGEVDGQTEHKQGALTCIGILPGLGCYNDSSDSEMSTDSDQECPGMRVDMLGRIIKKKQEDPN